MTDQDVNIQDPESDRDPRPWWRRPWIIAVVVYAAFVVIGEVIFAKHINSARVIGTILGGIVGCAIVGYIVKVICTMLRKKEKDQQTSDK